MSENIENQSVDTELNTEKVSEQMEETEQNTPVESPVQDNAKEQQPEFSFDTFKKLFDILVKHKQELEHEQKAKQDYLSANLADYNTEDYLQNPEFNALYGEAFQALGTNLDTKKFIELLDKYVEARIQSHLKKENAHKENEYLTDKLGFQTGESKKNEKPLKFQDIPPEELEKYIAKYI